MSVHTRIILFINKKKFNSWFLSKKQEKICNSSGKAKEEISFLGRKALLYPETSFRGSLGQRKPPTHPHTVAS